MENLNEKGKALSGVHAWRFVRTGGFDQVLLETGEDLRCLPFLDQKLWVTLSCPAGNLEFDTRTLEMIDTDGDGRIRVPEILAAVAWACSVLRNPDELTVRDGALPLDAIDDTIPEGKRLLASARGILKNLGKPDSPVISVEDTTDTVKIFADTRFNGDGIVPPESADDEPLKGVIGDIMACVGSDRDRSGLPGVAAERVDRFYEAAGAYNGWWERAFREAGDILPLGEGTGEAAAALEAVKSKVEDWFVRSNLAVFDKRAVSALNIPEKDYESLTSRNLSAADRDIAALPVARVEPGMALPLKKGINPAWEAPLNRFRLSVVAPLLGDRESLTAEEWTGLKERFAPYEAWQSAKAGSAVDKLGLDRVRQVLSDGSRERIADLIRRDRDLEGEAAAIADVEKLVRYRRDLYTLLNNFVTFRSFYSPDEKAIFQAGTLYLDGRSCDLCVRVADMKKHSALASLSRIYLAYCECSRDGGRESMTIAAAFTGGDADQLMAGRNGVFYDRMGRDWDATIVRIVEHPISIRQAFWAPYKRIGRMIGEQLEKIAASREKAVETQAATGVAAAGKAAQGDKAALPFDVGKFAGIFAAIGLAIGAIGTALASIVTGFLKLVWWQVPLAVAGLILAISGPSVVIAWMKLRHRNLGPLLDAGGWAVNSRVKINLPFGEALTSLARLPGGATRLKEDPYAGRSRSRAVILVIVLLALAVFYLWQAGYLSSGLLFPFH